MGSAGSVPQAQLQTKLTRAECQKQFGTLYDEASYNAYQESDGCITVASLGRIVESKFDVFLAHNWGNELGVTNHERVQRINRVLVAEGLRTWFDEKKLEGDVNSQIMQAVDYSRCVLIFVTKRFMEAVNGKSSVVQEADSYYKLQFSYCRKLPHNRIIAVVMEKRMCNKEKWEGDFGEVMRQCLVVDVSSESFFDTRMNHLITRITHEIGRPISKVIASINFGKTDEEIAIKDLDLQLMKTTMMAEMESWFNEHTTIDSTFITNYVKVLFESNIRTVEELLGRVSQQETLLIDLGFTEKDTIEIITSLVNQLNGDGFREGIKNATTVEEVAAFAVVLKEKITKPDQSKRSIQTNNKIAITFFRAVAKLCDSARNQRHFGESTDFFSNCIAILRVQTVSPDVMVHGSLAIKLLCRFNETVRTEDSRNVSELGLAGACEYVTASLINHGGDDSALADNSLAAMTFLASNQYNREQFQRSAINAVIEMLMIHGLSVPTVACYGLGALSELAVDNDEIRASLGSLGVCELLVDVLLAHTRSRAKNRMIEAYGLSAMCALVQHNPENRARFGASEGCEAVVEVLASDGFQDIELCMLGLSALCYLAGDPANLDRFGVLGSCDLVVGILKFHVKSGKVRALSQALTAVHYLSTHSANCGKLVDGEISEPLFTVLGQHGEKHAELAAHCFSVIVNLTEDENANKTTLLTTERAKCIVDTLLFHAKGTTTVSLSVTANGLRAIKCLIGNNMSSAEMFGNTSLCRLILLVFSAHIRVGEACEAHSLPVVSAAEAALMAMIRHSLHSFSVALRDQHAESVLQELIVDNKGIAEAGLKQNASRVLEQMKSVNVRH